MKNRYIQYFTNVAVMNNHNSVIMSFHGSCSAINAYVELWTYMKSAGSNSSGSSSNSVEGPKTPNAKPVKAPSSNSDFDLPVRDFEMLLAKDNHSDFDLPVRDFELLLAKNNCSDFDFPVRDFELLVANHMTK